MNTFEQVDAHIEENFSENISADAVAAGKIDLCGIWKIAKPILTFFVSFPFFPKKWRETIAALSGGIDTICAGK